ncbi:MAG: NHLP bacteriocin system secretion protein [Cyanobacteria bacterium J06633_8]
MSEEKNSIFREKALNQLSSPEQLDRLMQVVSPKDWLLFGGLGVFATLGVVWSLKGNISITVQGKGILINPRQVVQFQSPISGQLKSLKIRNGQCVKKNDILAIVDPSDKKQQLQQQVNKLAQLKQQAAKTGVLRKQRMQLETEAIAAERNTLQQRLQDTQSLNPRIKDDSLKSISEQRRSLGQSLKDAKELTPVLQQRLTKQQELQKQGAISQERVLEAEQEYRQARQKISEIQVQLQQLQVQETEIQQRSQDNINSITRIKADLEKLGTRTKQLEQTNLETINIENNQIEEVRQNIARLRKEIGNSAIKSPHTGCILEITATVGQYVNPGNRLGTLRTTRIASEMLSVNYFALKNGKKIKPGMKILITPDTVKRTRFGGIVGEIKQVSSFPVTSEGATSVVGNSEVVRNLMGEEGGRIEAVAKLAFDSKTFSGYKWSSSKGPQQNISPGTTTTVKVTVEERKPITFVLPILREWSGIESS